MRLVFALAIAVLVVAPGPARAVSSAEEVCATADPCVVSERVRVDDGAVLDFGARAVEVAARGRLDAGAGSMTILARRLHVRGNGRLLSGGRDITVITAGDVVIDAQGLVDVTASDPGNVTITAGGAVEIRGLVDAHPGGRLDGGSVRASGTTVTVFPTGRINCGGGRDGVGGIIDLEATGALAVNGPLDAGGGDSGGSIELMGSTVTASGRLVVSGGPGGAGASLSITAAGAITVSGAIDGTVGANPVTGGGLGAEVVIVAGGPIELDGSITLTATQPEGEGGTLDVSSPAEITQRGAIIAEGRGLDGIGGEVRITGGGTVTVGSINVSGGSAGNRLSVSSDALVRLTGQLRADGSEEFAGLGGGIDVQGCGVDMDSTALLSTSGPDGQNVVAARGQMVLRGTLVAGRSNLLAYGNVALPPILPGSFTPVATVIVDPALPPCEVLPGATTTTLPGGGGCATGGLETFDTLLCRLAAIQVSLAEAPEGTFAKARIGRQLGKRAKRAVRAVEKARSTQKVKRVRRRLRAAGRQLAKLARIAERRLGQGKIDATFGAALLDLTGGAVVGLEDLRAGLEAGG